MCVCVCVSEECVCVCVCVRVPVTDCVIRLDRKTNTTIAIHLTLSPLCFPTTIESRESNLIVNSMFVTPEKHFKYAQLAFSLRQS